MSLELSWQSLIDEELAIHERVKEAVREEALARRGQNTAAQAKSILDLRDQASTASARDLPAIFDQLHSSQMVAQKVTNYSLPDMRAPYFARIRIKSKGLRTSSSRDLLIGHETFISPKHNVFIIDWKNAPLAKVYFQYKQGEDYEVELPDERILEGQLELRHTLTFHMGQLIGISAPGIELRNIDGRWLEDESAQLINLAGGEGVATREFGTGQTRVHKVDIAALLDPQQYQILQASEREPLLILGAAGSGKTTVALYRLATLVAKDPGFFQQHKMLVIVPEPGLARLTKKLLHSLKLDRILVGTYDDWVAEQSRHVLGSVVKEIYSTPPPRVTRLKRHPSVFAVFPQLAAIKQRKIARLIGRKLYFMPDIAAQFTQQKGANLASIVEAFFQELEAKFSTHEDPKRSQQQLKLARELKSEVVADLKDMSSDRLELFLNKDILTEIVNHSNRELDFTIVQEVVKHTRDQITPPEGPRTKDLDPEYQQALDDRDVVEEEEIYNTIDVDDLTILLELRRYYFGELAGMHTYTHILLDEAQELAPTELRLLGRQLAKGGSVTVAGDAVQHTDPGSVFKSWDASLKALGYENIVPRHLNTSYRCPAPVMKMAYHVLGPLAPQDKAVAVRSGKPVMVSRASNEGHAVAMMYDALQILQSNEPRASIAVIARDMTIAKRIYAGLSDLPAVRLVYNGEFDFKPGIDIADVTQTKGLEFDYVIIPDCDIYSYPESDEHRRLLHVAVTRAIYQLWMIGAKSPSHLLPREALVQPNNIYH